MGKRHEFMYVRVCIFYIQTYKCGLKYLQLNFPPIFFTSWLLSSCFCAYKQQWPLAKLLASTVCLCFKMYRLSVYLVSYQCQRHLISVRYHYLLTYTLNYSYILGHYGLFALAYGGTVHLLWTSWIEASLETVERDWFAVKYLYVIIMLL